MLINLITGIVMAKVNLLVNKAFSSPIWSSKIGDDKLNEDLFFFVKGRKSVIDENNENVSWVSSVLDLKLTQPHE